MNRFVLSAAQQVDKGIEVKFSPSGTTLTSPAGKVVKAKRKGSLLSYAELIAPVQDEGAFRRAMEPFEQNEEGRGPVEGEEVRPEGLLERQMYVTSETKDRRR